MIWYDIWHDMTWHDMIWYDMIWNDISLGNCYTYTTIQDVLTQTKANTIYKKKKKKKKKHLSILFYFLSEILQKKIFHWFKPCYLVYSPISVPYISNKWKTVVCIITLRTFTFSLDQNSCIIDYKIIEMNYWEFTIAKQFNRKLNYKFT